jgi:hypothetical protein
VWDVPPQVSCRLGEQQQQQQQQQQLTAQFYVGRVGAGCVRGGGVKRGVNTDPAAAVVCPPHTHLRVGERSVLRCARVLSVAWPSSPELVMSSVSSGFPRREADSACLGAAQICAWITPTGALSRASHRRPITASGSYFRHQKS